MGSYLATLVAGVLPSTLGFGSANFGFGCRSDGIVQKQMTNFEKTELNSLSIYISNKPAAEPCAHDVSLSYATNNQPDERNSTTAEPKLEWSVEHVAHTLTV